MNDKSFLKNAVRLSFHQPLITGKDIKIARSGSGSDFVFHSISAYKLQPCYFSVADFHKISTLAQKCILHSKRFDEEYQVFKHYLSENVVIPTDSLEAQKIQLELKLSALSRAAAQKKKMLSAVIPGDFAYQFSLLMPQYKQYLKQLTLFEKENPIAVNCCYLSEFSTAYQQATKGFHCAKFMFWINKKRFLSYLCEAIQILRFQPKLPDDYLETRLFIGEKSLILSSLTYICRSRLQYLLAILENMAQQDDLLQNAQKLLAFPNENRKIIQQYRSRHTTKKLPEISNLRQNTKKLFRQYAFLTYLDGVRSSFEYKLDDTPLQKQPPLPTVAPGEELKKIRQLVSESIKTKSSGDLNKIYLNALKQFAQTLHEVQKSIAEFS